MGEKIGAELVPGGAVEILQIRLFVVAPENGELRKATQPDEGGNGGLEITQHLKQQPEVVAEGWLLGLEDKEPGFECFLSGLLELKTQIGRAHV